MYGDKGTVSGHACGVGIANRKFRPQNDLCVLNRLHCCGNTSSPSGPCIPRHCGGAAIVESNPLSLCGVYSPVKEKQYSCP